MSLGKQSPLRPLSYVALVVAGLAGALVLSACGPLGGATPPETSDSAPTAVAGAFATPTALPPSVWVLTNPRFAMPGQQIAVSAQGFAPGESVGVTLLDGTGNPVAGPLVSPVDLRGSAGGITLTVPAAIAPGDYVVDAKGESSEREAKIILWVRDAPPAMNLSADSARPQQPITVNLNGFAPRERIVIYVEGQGADPLTAQDADAQGNLRADNVRVPLVQPGDLQLVAAGSVSLAQARHSLKVLAFDPQVGLNATVLPPGEAVGFFGSGFAARDNLQVTLDGANELAVNLTTDDNGFLRAPSAFKLPANLKGPQNFAIIAQISGSKLRIPFDVVASYPLIELGSYFVRPGDDVSLSVRYLRPRERIDLYLGEGGQRKKIATLRADDQGWLTADTRFQIPPNTPPGAVTIALDGEAARPPMRAKAFVTQ